MPEQHKIGPKGLPDDPRQANESGEPEEAGRTRGQVLDGKADANNDPAGQSKPGPDTAQHWESGRQDAMKG